MTLGKPSSLQSLNKLRYNLISFQIPPSILNPYSFFLYNQTFQKKCLHLLASPSTISFFQLCWEWERRNKQVAKGWFGGQRRIFKQERLESYLATKRNDQVEREILILEKKEGLTKQIKERVWDPETSGGIVFNGDISIVTGRKTGRVGTIWFVYRVTRIWWYVFSNGFYFLANYETRVGDIWRYRGY